jgi:hypothetical protein
MAEAASQSSGILPSPKINTLGPGIMGPDYSFADSLPTPDQIGVRDGDTVDSVVGAVRGVAYYTDTIGFGGPSSFISQGMGLKPMGVQVWMKTGVRCSNGANMWSYMDGIPTGNSLGKGLATNLANGGLPGLKGLAPGMLEDVQSALDPLPIMQSVFGTGYAVCKQEERTVGDQDGRISKKDDKGNTIYYVENPETVVERGGKSYQTRWVLDHNITHAEWKKAPKIYCPDGSLNRGECTESFRGSMGNLSMGKGIKRKGVGSTWTQMILIAVALGGLYLLSYAMRKRRR